MKQKSSLYEQIGETKLAAIIHDFYEMAFSDVIIGHFFFGRSHRDLVEKQIQFTRILLGGPRPQSQPKPQSMARIHQPLNIRPAHFDRRRRLLEAAMTKHQLSVQQKKVWLQLEDRLRSQIVKSTPSP